MEPSQILNNLVRAIIIAIKKRNARKKARAFNLSKSFVIEGTNVLHQKSVNPQYEGQIRAKPFVFDFEKKHFGYRKKKKHEMRFYPFDAVKEARLSEEYLFIDIKGQSLLGNVISVKLRKSEYKKYMPIVTDLFPDLIKIVY